jgi:hypothetical protein
MSSPIEWGGDRYPTRTDLARQLRTLTGHSVNACEIMLRQFGDDPDAVIAHYQKADTRVFTHIGSRSYRTREDFLRYVSRYYRVPKTTVASWLQRGRSVDEVLAAAKELHSHQLPSDFPTGPVTIFGWRFRSYNALGRYYRRGKRPPDSWREVWCEHVAAGESTARFGPLLETIAELWGWGELDEHNRHSRETEAQLPSSCLPLNADTGSDEVTDDDERKFIDALQPAEAQTLRRLALARLEQRRASATAF